MQHLAAMAPPGSSTVLSLILTGVAVIVVVSLLVYRFATRKRRSR
jgi:hypothetical protein